MNVRLGIDFDLYNFSPIVWGAGWNSWNGFQGCEAWEGVSSSTSVKIAQTTNPFGFTDTFSQCISKLIRCLITCVGCYDGLNGDRSSPWCKTCTYTNSTLDCGTWGYSINDATWAEGKATN